MGIESNRNTTRGVAGPGTLIAIVVLVVMLLAALMTVWLNNATSSNAVSAESRPAMGPLEMHTNRLGRDLSDAGARADSASQCAAMCAANDACKAMSFASGASGASGMCWLKGSLPEGSANDAITSAVKSAPAR